MFPSPEVAFGAAPARGGESLSPEERAELLAMARASIVAALERQSYTPEPRSQRLRELRGAFVTLHRGQELRGCIGFPLANEPLYRAVASAAIQSARHDPRFPPVTLEELPQLRINISVLSPLFPIAPGEIEIGKHGLMISLGAARGLLLPQVPVEHGWTTEEFLENTCMKAHLPRDAWKHGASLEGFTAEVFGEEEKPYLRDTAR